MKKILVILVGMMFVASVGYAARLPIPPPPISIFRAADCSFLTTMGFLCQDTDDGKLYKWDGATLVEITAASGTGDITDVWNSSGGDVETLVAGAADSLNLTSGSYSIPWVVGADCSAVTAEGRSCWDSDDNILYVGDGAAASAIISSTLGAAIDSAEITNGVIINEDINAAAAIAFSKLAALTSAHILVGSAGGVATDVAVSGDVTMSNLGAVSIGNDKITEAMLKAVDAASDEDILTYESTTGDFEWHSATELKATMSLNSVENTALSTWAGTSNVVTVGTIGTGAWNATAIPGAKVDIHGTTEETTIAADDEILIYDATASANKRMTRGNFVSGLAGGGGVILDLADNGVDESTAIAEIATSGDTNSIFTEPSNDKLLIDLSKKWPAATTADTATALVANGSNCSAGYAPLGVDASGAVEGCWQAQPLDATLTALAGLTIADVSVIEGTGADAVAVVSSAGALRYFRSNAGNTALEFAAITLDDISDGSIYQRVAVADVDASGHVTRVMTNAGGLITFDGPGDNFTMTFPTSAATIAAIDKNQNISGTWEVQDGVNLKFGNDADWGVYYDETTDDRLEFVHAAGAGADVYFDLNDNAAASTFSIVNSDGTYAANLVVDGTISEGGTALASKYQGLHAYLTDISGITGTQGDIIYFNGSNWVDLAPSTLGYFLQTRGAGANPIWAAGSATGVAGAYAADWNGDTASPQKNDLYDYLTGIFGMSTTTATFNTAITATSYSTAASETPTLTLADSTASATGTGDIKVDAYTAGQAAQFRVYVDETGGEDVLYMTVDGAGTEILFAKKIDLTSAGIENVGAISDDGAISVVSSGSTVTVESVVFTGGAMTDVTALTMGSATVDTGIFTMIKGAQTSDPQATLTLSADGVGGLTIATANGSNGDITLTPSGGETILTTDLTVSGGDIVLGTTSIFSGGDTASLNNIDAIDATTEATIETALDTLANVTSVGTLTSITTSGSITLQNSETIANSTDTQIVFTSNGNEDLILDLDTATDNEVTLSSSTGVTQLGFSALNLVTTGTLQAGMVINSDANGMSGAEMTAAGVRGTLFVATGGGTWILPDAVGGESLCIADSGTAHDIIVDCENSNVITLKGTALTANLGITNAAGSTTGDFVCFVATAADNWMTLGMGGTWASQ